MWNSSNVAIQAHFSLPQDIASTSRLSLVGNDVQVSSEPRRNCCEPKESKRRGLDATRKRKPSGVDMPRTIFDRYLNALPDGEYEFATIREDYHKWLRSATTINAISDVMLGKWCASAGLVKRRVGKEKVTVYRKGEPRKTATKAAQVVSHIGNSKQNLNASRSGVGVSAIQLLAQRIAVQFGGLG